MELRPVDHVDCLPVHVVSRGTWLTCDAVVAAPATKNVTVEEEVAAAMQALKGAACVSWVMFAT